MRFAQEHAMASDQRRFRDATAPQQESMVG